MGQLKWIEFYTENCEIIRVDGKYVGDLVCENFVTRIARTAANSIDKITTAEFAVELFAGGNEDTTYEEDPFAAATTYERLSYCDDIAEVSLYMNDGVESFYPIWEDASPSGDENMYQASYISSLGNMYITISTKPLEHYFNKETIDDEEYMKLKAELYGIESEGEDD